MYDFDDLVMGAGMAGLTVGALLAKQGRRVCVVEAHDAPGGYAHSFRMKGYRFCAQVHYVFGCGEGETIHTLLSRLDAVERVPFVRLDPEGFDHIVVDGERVRVPNGLAKYRERLVHLYPEHKGPLRQYFDTIVSIADEMDRLDELPSRLTLRSALATFPTLPKYRHLLRWARATLDDLYDHVGMPQRLRAILAGQSGDYLLPPRDVSVPLHVALVSCYDRGAYYPRGHYFHFVETIADAIRREPGCQLLLEHEVERILVERGRVVGVRTTNGRTLTAARYVSNIDPRRTAELAGREHFGGDDARRIDYAYSAGTFTLYLGVSGIDLRDHGFGSFNVWHYPQPDLNRQYDDQLVRHDLRDPWLFMSTPSLHSDAPGLCPPGHQVLEIATACDYAFWVGLRRRDRRAYNLEKKKVRDRILEIVEERYVPGLCDHLAMRVTGTPVTNERFCRAPEGNAYGAALTPAHVGIGRRPFQTALGNLWMVNATAGLPSVSGAVSSGLKLYEILGEQGRSLLRRSRPTLRGPSADM